MRQQLNGTLTATLKDGYLKGIDIDYAERKLHAQIKHEPLPTKPEKPQTGFSKLDAAFHLQNGIAHTQTLTAQLPHARMQGSGDIDLVREQLNMTLNFKFSSDVQGQTGKSYAELDRVALPVHLRGPLTKPEYDIDFDAALKALLQREIDKRKADEKAKVEQKIQQEKQQLKEKLQQKADDFLKNLLNR
jgi:AsmA protein